MAACLVEDVLQTSVIIANNMISAVSSLHGFRNVKTFAICWWQGDEALPRIVHEQFHIAAEKAVFLPCGKPNRKMWILVDFLFGSTGPGIASNTIILDSSLHRPIWAVNTGINIPTARISGVHDEITTTSKNFSRGLTGLIGLTAMKNGWAHSASSKNTHATQSSLQLLTSGRFHVPELKPCHRNFFEPRWVAATVLEGNSEQVEVGMWSVDDLPTTLKFLPTTYGITFVTAYGRFARRSKVRETTGY